MSGAGEATASVTGGSTPPPPAVHAEDIGTFLERLDHSSSAGLSESEARDRLSRHGPNRLPEGKKKSALLRILQQFINPLVLTLLAAAAIAVVVGISAKSEHGLLGRFGDAIAILLIVILNAFLGYYQERRAEA